MGEVQISADKPEGALNRVKDVAKTPQFLASTTLAFMTVSSGCEPSSGTDNGRVWAHVRVPVRVCRDSISDPNGSGVRRAGIRLEWGRV